VKNPRARYATVFTHLEPLEDPRSYADTRLDREQEQVRGMSAADQ
jgi:hypothetical protein